MRHTLKIISITACMLILLAGCNNKDNSSVPTETTPVTQPIIDASQLYKNAAREITEATGLSFTITRNTTVTKNSQSFAEESNVTLSYTGLGQGQMAAEVFETLTVGDHHTEIAEHYADNTAYCSVNGIGFSSKMADKDFISRYLPAALLDAELYDTIQAEAAENQMIIHFSDPEAPEVWACNSNYQLSAASGTATLDKNGHLESCSYSFQGTYEDITIEVSAAVTIQTTSITAPDLPDDLKEYTPIDFLDAPRYLERATGHLLQNKSVSATNKQQIHSQAFMLSRTMETKLDMYQEGSIHNSRRSTTVTSSNTAPEGIGSQYVQDELYKDGKYMLLVDGKLSNDNPNINATNMHSYCQDLLVSTVLMPQHITRAEFSQEASIMTLHFTANDTLAHILAEQVCATLYNDPALLSSLASEYETTKMEAYLTVDAVTGLPLASGLNYSGEHTIDDFTYVLTSQQDQTYEMASKTAKQAIEALTAEDAQSAQTAATETTTAN